MQRIKQSGTLSDKAYQVIKKAIVHGKLKDNELLPEEKLANELGISRTPLRDALRRLTDEGLVTQKRGSPAQVSSFSKDKSLEYMELRVLLEVYNIEKVTSKLDAKTIQTLKENVNEQLEALEQENYQYFMDLDREFHLLLASKNSNQELEKIIQRLNTGTNRAFLILSKTLPQSAMDAYKEHVEIIQALEDKNASLAGEKMREHLNNIVKRFLIYYGGEL